MDELIVNTKLEVFSEEECDLSSEIKIEPTEPEASIDSNESVVEKQNGVSLLQPPPLIWTRMPPNPERSALLFHSTSTIKTLKEKPKIEGLNTVNLSGTDMTLPPPLIWLNKPGSKCASSLAPHIETKLESKGYKTQQMEVSSSNNNTLRTSYKKTKKQKLYKCNSCNFHTKYPKYFQLHQLKHAFDKGKFDNSYLAGKGVEIFLCNGCSMVFVREGDLRAHLAVAHATIHVELFQCPKCDFQCEKAMDLINHQISHKCSYGISSRISKKAFKCIKCSFTSDSKENCHNHIERYRNHVFKVNIEGVGFSDGRFFECKKCRFQTRYADYIKLHMGTHSDVNFSENADSPPRLLYCQKCDFSTIFSQYLELHMHKHGSTDETATGTDCTNKAERLLSCEFCSFHSKFEYELQLHVQLHHQSLLLSDQSDDSEYFDNQEDSNTSNCDDKLEYASFSCENHGSSTTHLDEHMLGHNYSFDSDTYPCKIEGKHFLQDADRQICEQIAKEDSQNDNDDVLGPELKSLSSEVKCQVCDFKTRYAECLELHNKKHIKSEESQIVDHQSTSESEKRTCLTTDIFYCNNCSFQSGIKKHLELHMSKHNPQDKGYQEIDCDNKPQCSTSESETRTCLNPQIFLLQ